MKEYDTRLLAALVVPAMGADLEWVSQQLVCDLERHGHRGRLVIRSDQDLRW